MGRTMTNREFLKFLYKSIDKYKHKLALLYILTFIFKSFMPYYVLPYILKIIGDSYEARILTLGYGLSLIFFYAMIYCSGYLMAALVNSRLSYRTEHQIEKDARVNLFIYSLKHSMSYFNNNMSDTVASKINNVSSNIIGFLNKFVFIFSDFLSIVLIAFVYLSINIYLSIFFILWCFLFFYTSYSNIKRLNKYSSESSEENNKISGLINDNFSNILNIKSFSKQREEVKNIRKHSVMLLAKDYAFIKNLNLTNFTVFLLLVLLIFVIFSSGFYLVYKKSMTIGTFMFLCQNIIFIKSVIVNFLNKVFEAVEDVASIRVGVNTILRPTEINNMANARNLEKVNGKIIFRNVRFGYGRL